MLISICGWHNNYKKDKGKGFELKKRLFYEFKMKELGTLRYFLGTKVANQQKDFCYHKKYILDLLKETTMLGCKLASNPI